MTKCELCGTDISGDRDSIVVYDNNGEYGAKEYHIKCCPAQELIEDALDSGLLRRTINVESHGDREK